MAKQERAERTRESLVRSAAEVFAEEGYGAASVAAIAARSAVTTGALHFHFDGKSALARIVEDRAADAVRRIILTAGEKGGGRAGDPLGVLADSTYTLLALLAEDVVVRAGFALSADRARASGVDLRGQWQRWIGELIDGAQRAGLLAEGVSSQDAARAVVASTVGLEVLGASDPDWAAAHTPSWIGSLILTRMGASKTD
ncbi:ScbR family autoregulator-binding transcription factor [Streptomyces sp. NPDC003042]